MNTKTIFASIFAYAGDEELVLETILCLMESLPEARIKVIDDLHEPCSARVRHLAQIMGARWETSRRERQKGFRGKEGLEDVLTHMLSDSASDSDILLKIDPDTALLDASELIKFADSKKILWACGSPDHRIFGHAFALKAGPAARLLRQLECMTPAGDEPVDIIMRDLICEQGCPATDGEVHSLWWIAGTLAPWARYDWNIYPEVTRYRRFGLVTTGTSSSHASEREHRARVMRNLRLDRE